MSNWLLVNLLFFFSLSSIPFRLVHCTAIEVAVPIFLWLVVFFFFHIITLFHFDRIFLLLLLLSNIMSNWKLMWNEHINRKRKRYTISVNHCQLIYDTKTWIQWTFRVFFNQNISTNWIEFFFLSFRGFFFLWTNTFFSTLALNILLDCHFTAWWIVIALGISGVYNFWYANFVRECMKYGEI